MNNEHILFQINENLMRKLIMFALLFNIAYNEKMFSYDKTSYFCVQDLRDFDTSMNFKIKLH